MLLQYFTSIYLWFKFRIIFSSSAALIDMLETSWNSPASATGQKLLPSPRVAPAISGCWSQGGRRRAIRVSRRWQESNFHQTEDRRFFSSYRKTIQPYSPCKPGPALAKRKTNYAYYAAVHCRCYSTPSCYPQPSCLGETFLVLVCFWHKQRWATMLQRTQLDRRSWQRMQRQNLTRCSASTNWANELHSGRVRQTAKWLQFEKVNAYAK